MNKFFLDQIRFLSGTTAILLCWQSLAIANPNLNKKLKLKNSPEWVAQLSNQNQDVLVPNPIIEIDGKPVDPAKMQTTAPPPFIPRAVAPPVGDMSISNIRTDLTPRIDFGANGQTSIPRLVLRDAPANEVLALLARAAGYNIIFTDQKSEGNAQTPANNQFTAISLELEGEKIQDVFNNVLMLSGLQASQRGSTIVVGKTLPSTARNLITRTIRLNQASPEGAANFLATQGAEVAIVFTPVERQFNPETGAVIREIQGVTQLRPVKVPDNEATSSALPLRGLQVTTDDRTGSINLVGESHLVAMASSFLTQLDLRRRQVAVNVKVIDVQLNQEDSFGASFSFNINDTGVVQDGGVGVINFGTSNQNVNTQQWRVDDQGNLVSPFNESFNITDTLSENFTNTLSNTIDGITEETTNDLARSLTEAVTRTLQGIPMGVPNSGQISPFGNTADPTQPQNSALSVPGGNFNVPNAFLAQIRANIQSGNAKILTDPTLVVQEGQTGGVKLVENVVTSVETEIDTESGVRTVTPVIEPAGLTLSVEVQKIDDNGFINLIVNPTISAPGTPQTFSSGGGADNTITPLVERTVSSGLIRLRDGQTLILSGIISDSERTQASKIPILGDLPIIGSLFRSTFKDKTRSEVIVVLTPQVLDDSEGYSGYGYNYTPSRETGEFLREKGLNVPTSPY